jgi:hypothetical protein
MFGVVVPVITTGTDPEIEVTGGVPELADVIRPNASTVKEL